MPTLRLFSFVELHGQIRYCRLTGFCACINGDYVLDERCEQSRLVDIAKVVV